MEGYIFRDIIRHIGQTVTVFTTSGGLSGDGFTGVLLTVDDDVIRLLCDEGAAPACPVGSACNCCMPPFGMNYGYGGYGYGGYGCNDSFGCDSGCVNRCGFSNLLGSVAVIPIRSIAAFVHHAI